MEALLSNNNNIEEVLFELNFSQLRYNMVSKTILRMDKPNTILLVLPDTNVEIFDIYNSGIFLFNADNIIIPNRILRILNKR